LQRLLKSQDDCVILELAKYLSEAYQIRKSKLETI